MEVLLTWNHPQFDGAGAKVFHEDFLEMLNNVKNGSYERPGLDGDILRLPQEPPLLPIPIESLRDLPVVLKYLAKMFWEEIRPQFLNWDVSQAAWSLCRQNNTTITGLLNGLALITFSLRLESTVASVFQCATIMDHRRNLPPAPPDAPWVRSDKVVANYVTQVFHTFDTKQVAQIRSKLPADTSKGRDLSPGLQHELWAASTQNRLEIVRKLKGGLQNDLIGVFKCVTDWQQTMSNMGKKKRQFSWLVTNVGVLDGGTSRRLSTTSDAGLESDDDDQRWSIDRAQFGLSAEIPAAAIEFAPISVAGRGMCVNANWSDCAVDTVFGERIMADLERWLNKLAMQS
ncbi:hypothetical protein M426DRAFT_13887 [Hypoxylon sp. CI-4A]|nr:hypothetical protein M426DRAFT_13887 [Hypoxylon sp. CI-4A]